MHDRNAFCGRSRTGAERAKAGPRHQPDHGAKQPRAKAPAPHDAQQPAKRRLFGRHRQLAPPRLPLPGHWEDFQPPAPPALQRRGRNPAPSRDRLKAHAAGHGQRAHHHEQRPGMKPAPEETNRWRLHAAPANTTAQAEASDIVAKFRRQTVRLAWVGRAVKRPAAARAARRAAGLRLGRVDLRKKIPDPCVGNDGVAEQLVRHWDRLWRSRPSPRQALRRPFCKIAGGHPTPNLD